MTSRSRRYVNKAINVIMGICLMIAGAFLWNLVEAWGNDMTGLEPIFGTAFILLGIGLIINKPSIIVL